MIIRILEAEKEQRYDIFVFIQKPEINWHVHRNDESNSGQLEGSRIQEKFDTNKLSHNNSSKDHKNKMVNNIGMVEIQNQNFQKKEPEFLQTMSHYSHLKILQSNPASSFFFSSIHRWWSILCLMSS